jgi:hypothetical protein
MRQDQQSDFNSSNSGGMVTAVELASPLDVRKSKAFYKENVIGEVMQKDFLRSVQDFIVNAFSIGIVRNMGPKGTLGRIRESLKKIDLAAISKKDPSQFFQVLDDLTEKVRRDLPKGARHWGVARKCLNLFFRDVLYNFLFEEGI